MIDINNLEGALARLNETFTTATSELSRNDPKLARPNRAATIQAFENPYDLSHKILRRYLESTEPSPTLIDKMSYPELIRMGIDRGLLQTSWEAWLQFRKVRANTGFTHDDRKAKEVFEAIPLFIQDVSFMCSQINLRQAQA